MTKTFKKQIKVNGKVGRLRLVRKFRRNNRDWWFCICKCGGTKEVVGYSLVSGATKSCGCLAKEVSSRPMGNTERKKLSETRKQRIALGLIPKPIGNHTSRKHSQEEKDKRAASNRGKKRTPEQRLHLSAGIKKALADPKVRDKYRRAAKRSWANPIIAARMISAILTASGKHPNGLEKRVMGLLDIVDKHNWKFVGDGSLVLCKKCPDFVHKTRRLLVEAFGRFWHEAEDEPNRIQYFENLGYKTLVLWEDESNESMLEKIRRFLLEDDFANGKR